ncbi:MAG: peptidoglycan DD-metalloendopeptidase family protein [Chitinophagales bacterium]
MTGWSDYFRHPLVILTCSLLTVIALAGLAGPEGRSQQASSPAAGGQAAAALPFSAAPLTPSGNTLPVTPVVRRAPSGELSTRPAVAVNPADPKLVRAVQLRVSKHVVGEGETLSAIAVRYGTDLETLQGLNPGLDPDRLHPGQTMKVMNGRGSVYTVKPGDSLTSISKRFSLAVAKIQAANGLLSDEISAGQELILPGIRPRRRDDELTSRGLSALYFAWPTRGWITSRFGRRWGRVHEGIDIAVYVGHRVVAAAPGRVTFAGWYAGYGRLVTIDHGHGIVTRYAHNSRLLVKPGQWVDRGDPIALSGNSGSSTGPHVHFEVRVNGRPQNPLNWLRRS